MKRSEINQAIKRLESFINEYRFALPPFLGFTPEDWRQKGHEYDEIRDNSLGWDVTDYGLGNFAEVGFALITLRNGKLNSDKYIKTYAEKLLFLEEGQYAPMHFHWLKMEDIINRGGGNILIKVYNSTSDEQLADTDVLVNVDGRRYTVPAGTQVRLTPGESISLSAGMYHDFSVEKGSGPVLLGEVSMVNDDNTDNRFLEPIGRFPTIEEDEAPYRLLCNEYPDARA
ncbi:MAG: D-lyxose/D-mannose family sugar isomerase [Eubacteriaceae bacterium]|nr:D-lyxose/D-mannose family sugar isomerase [Eubacteriaceae bacterium]